jgi:hypothetical protein
LQGVTVCTRFASNSNPEKSLKDTALLTTNAPIVASSEQIIRGCELGRGPTHPDPLGSTRHQRPYLIELHDDRAPVEFSESDSIFCEVKLQLSVENDLDQKGPERIAMASLS